MVQGEPRYSIHCFQKWHIRIYWTPRSANNRLIYINQFAMLRVTGPSSPAIYVVLKPIGNWPWTLDVDMAQFSASFNMSIQCKAILQPSNMDVNNKDQYGGRLGYSRSSFYGWLEEIQNLVYYTVLSLYFISSSTFHNYHPN